MNNNTLVELASLPDAQYDLNPPKQPWWKFWSDKPSRGGWIKVWRDIEDGKKRIHLMWTSEKDSHFMLSSIPAQSLTLDADGNLICFMESAISMWVKWGYGKGNEEDLSRAHKFATWVHSRLYPTGE